MRRMFQWFNTYFTPNNAPRMPKSAAWRRRHWIEKAVAGIGEAMIATDLAGRVMFLNANAEALTGRALAKAYRRPLSETLPLQEEATGAPAEDPVARGLAGGDGSDWVRRKILVARDGRRVPVEYRAASIQAAGGRVEGVVLLVRDVTGRKQVQEAMAQLAAIVEFSDDAIVGVALDGTVTNWNEGARRLYGYDAEAIVGRSLSRIYPPGHTGELIETWDAVRRGEPVRHDDTARLRQDGTRVDVSVSLSPVRDKAGRVVGFSSIARDNTERKRAEEERLRAELLRRLADAQEEERRRIARELHDGMGQHLAALKLGIEGLRLGPHDPDRLCRLLELTRQVGQDMRRIALELRPTTLDDLGLKTALVNYVGEWSERSGIEADIQDAGLDQGRLPPPIETALYRIVQEALTNVLKHAQASRVTLILERRDDHALAIIEDDGQGFDYDAVMGTAVGGRRLGLLGVRERVTAAGGELQVETGPGKGTSLFIRVPLSRETG